MNQEHGDLLTDGDMYRAAGLNLSDSEFMELMRGIGALIQKAMLNEPSPERTARNIATIIPERKDK
ncbi:helix-turn-helix domain-containing protein [Peribacillus saganii]|uniref:hypothetical protein n=1 Tax=Peribacillus saganii TaxID=2303992 RepID=UPI0018F1560E|nr:hypothetical protein [Peribacillus saganii]